jgi:hypothetical protein
MKILPPGSVNFIISTSDNRLEDNVSVGNTGKLNTYIHKQN